MLRLVACASNRYRVVGAPEDETVVLPAPALKMLVGILDFLKYLSLTGIFRAHWSAEVQEEWIRNQSSPPKGQSNPAVGIPHTGHRFCRGYGLRPCAHTTATGEASGKVLLRSRCRLRLCYR